ncbi:hypothetical protein BDQ17DRAFT_1194510, partial [Cyathus striatus]
NSKGDIGKPGDKHYQCYHGGCRILTITKAMHCCLNGLIGNLKTASPTMYEFYNILKARRGTDEITEEELKIASGELPLNLPYFCCNWNAKWLIFIQGPFEQDKFESLLASWVVASDQPFEEVEQLEFR